MYNKMSSPEYTLCIDSSNRDKSRDNLQDTSQNSANNPTNDISLYTNLSLNRAQVTQMYLGSVELPLQQKVIEHDWKRLFFSEGLSLIVSDGNNINIREFTIHEYNDAGDTIDNSYTAKIPIWLNQVVSVDTTVPDSPIFETEFEHGLELRGSFDWGSPIQLISTNLIDPDEINLTTSNTHLTIIDATTFQLSGVSVVTWTSTNGVFGYVKSPTIPSPKHLAKLVTDGLTLDIGEQKYIVTFDETKSYFCIQPSTIPVQQKTVIYIPNKNSLPSIMGFGQISLQFKLLKQCEDEPKCETYKICGMYGYNCKSDICISPGDYTAETLLSEFNLQWNRFYFDQGCETTLDNAPTFIFSDSCGECFTITIPYGLYTPETFAEFIEDEMNILDGLGNTYNVEWDQISGTFTFTGTSVFGLEFPESSPDIHTRLGFSGISFRGRSTYVSSFPFESPMKGCCDSAIPIRFTSFVYNTVYIPKCNQFQFNVNKTKPIPVELTDNLDGTMLVTSSFAHGYQIDDVIEIFLGGVIYKVRVIDVVDALNVNVDIGTITDFDSVEDVAACSNLEGNVINNLFFAPMEKIQQLQGYKVGLACIDYLWNESTSNTPIQSIYSINLKHPPYILMIIKQPNGATHTEHRYKHNNIPYIFAKIVLYPNFRHERIYPMIMYLPSVTTLTTLHIEFRNPDHTLYNFHGRNWSATLCLRIPHASGSLLCK
jgi:hypothetical protein